MFSADDRQCLHDLPTLGYNSAPFSVWLNLMKVGHAFISDF